jgi:AraC-like DNA-binding protein
MPKTLLDTDILSEYLKGYAPRTSDDTQDEARSMLKNEISTAVAPVANSALSNVASSSGVPNTLLGPLPPEFYLPREHTLSACQVKRRSTREWRARAYKYMNDGDAIRFSPAPVVDCQKLAETFTFFLDKAALAGVKGAATIMGELVWIRLDEGTNAVTVAARPALVVYGATSSSADRMEIVPNVAPGDPLLQHIALVLGTRLQATTEKSHLYAELLADTLARHFLRRYRMSNRGVTRCGGGLPPYKMRRVLFYINEHLDQDLSLTRVAGIAQASVAHFSRLFKQATGSTLHHYVLACRIDRAKRLLMETDLPLTEVAQRVGFADQSHFTALFRTHAATTPRAYRNSTRSD